MSEVPSGWVAATLEDIAKWSSGGTPSRSNPSYYSGTIPWLKTGELGPPVVFQTEEHISEEAVASSSAKIFPKGSVAVAMYGATIGKASILGIDAATNQACAVGVPDASETKFLYYFLVSQSEAFANAGKGGAQPNISQGIVKSWAISVPPLAEQTRIVEKLEELLSDLDAGVAELKAAQKKLAQYRQSLLKAAVEGALTAEWRAARAVGTATIASSFPRKRESSILPGDIASHMDSRLRGNDGNGETGGQLLQRILTERRARWEAKQLAKFNEQGKTPPKDWQKKYPEPVQPDTSGLPELPEGWVWASVEQIASDEPYSLAIGPFGSNLKVPDYRESGVPLVFVRNIRSGNYGGTHTKYVTPEKAEELSAHRVDAGDVLITKMGEPPGDADVYPDGQPPAIITADCIKVRCWAGLVRPDLLKATINSHIGRQQIEPMTQGVAQKKVSLGRFTRLAVPVPPIQEQDELIALLGAATRETAAQEAAVGLSLKQSTAQRQNILRAAFAGQLVPQDPNDEPASVLLERIRAERAARNKVKKPRGHITKGAA
ncbi:MAG: restriction endonuclease subunit S [Aquimonas sp.]|nr:restriction endonuclease subunit S [Aquimonas sp.]